MRPNVVWLPASLDACALYRMYLPHTRLPGSVFIYNDLGMRPDVFAHCQIAVVQRLFSQDNFGALQMLKKNMGMKVVYDLDDDMWAPPAYNPMTVLIKKLKVGFNTCAMFSDMITVSTEHLKLMVRKALGKKCPPVEVVENALDFVWFRPLPEECRRDKNGKVVVGWAGTNTHSKDIEKVFGLIPSLLEELPEMEFEVVGGAQLTPELAKFGNRVRHRDFVEISEFASYWASWQWDVALAPLERNLFNLSKSNIKMVESAALKIPCVATEIGSYKAFASKSPLLKQTVLADSATQWREKIRALVKDRGLREKVGKEMYDVGFEHYNVDKRVNRWCELFEGLVA